MGKPKIYTVTYNPSLDYLVDVERLDLGKTNRSSRQEIYPGGKGVNVSMVLANMGIESVALGFSAGFTGQEIERRLEERGVNANFIKLEEGTSRINIKIRGEQETEINAIGPAITDEARAALDELLADLERGDYLVLAGSIPNTLPADTYELVLKSLEGRGVKAVVDATGELLVKVLPYHPYLVKPNNHELSEIAGRELATLEELAAAARELQAQGAQNVVVSMAGDGALFVPAEGDVLYMPAPKGTLVNSVGAGDSLVAGFVAGSYEGLEPAAVFKQAVCTGSASAFSELLATKAQVDALLAATPDPEVL